MVEITSMDWSDKEERTAKKPKSGASRYPRKHPKTNSLSLSASRPSPNLSRIAVALDNKDVVNYGAVDRRVGQGVRSRKTGAKIMVSAAADARHAELDLAACSQHRGNSMRARKRWRKAVSRRATIFVEEGKATLCVANCAAKERTGDIHVEDTMPDDHHMPYKSWKLHVIPLVDRVNEQLAKGLETTVRCRAGVNRSCTVAAAYLIRHCGFTVQEAVDKIESAKSGLNWDSFTNLVFLRHLDLFATECRRPSKNQGEMRNFLPEAESTTHDSEILFQ